MDADLEGMSREQLIAEVKRLRQGIREHRDSSLHELCWHHPALWSLLPEQTDPLPVVPSWPEFLRGCIRYRQSLDEQIPHAPRSDEPYDAMRPIEKWLQLVADKDAAGVDSLLAEDTVFHSPIVDTPQVGKDVTQRYLAAAFDVFSQESFRYVRTVVGERDAVLEFVVEIDGVTVNGVDMIRWNDEGHIVDFKVMLRPLKGVKVMHQKIAAKLQESP